MPVRDMIRGLKAAFDLIEPHPARSLQDADTDGALTMHQAIAIVVLDEPLDPRSDCLDEALITQRFELRVRHVIRAADREESLLDALDDHRRILRALHSSADLNRTGSVLVSGWGAPTITTDGDWITRRCALRVIEPVDLTEQPQ